MLASKVIEVIERRHAKFREHCHCPCAANLGEANLVNLRIIEEYDALMAEIEALRKAHPHGHAPVLPMGEYLEDRSEDWILGDQGQPGG